MRNFNITHQRAWSNVTIFSNKFVDIFHNDKITQRLEARENMQMGIYYFVLYGYNRLSYFEMVFILSSKILISFFFVTF